MLNSLNYPLRSFTGNINFSFSIINRFITTTFTFYFLRLTSYLLPHSVPFEYFQSNCKEDNSCHCQYQRWNCCLSKSCSFNEYRPYPIGESSEWQGFDERDNPIGEIVVTEKDPGKDHHRHRYNIYKGIADLCF